MMLATAGSSSTHLSASIQEARHKYEPRTRVRLVGTPLYVRESLFLRRGIGLECLAEFRLSSAECMGVTGLEPVTSSLSSWRSPN